jgi:hypothetical protein
MNHHEYGPEQALELLMQKLTAFDAELAGQVQAAIGAGKEVVETPPASEGRKKLHSYRKAVPLTHEEALQVALDALRVCSVDLPLCVNSAVENLAEAATNGSQHRPAATPDRLAHLLAQLHHEQEDVRSKAMAALGEIGPAAATPEIVTRLWELFTLGGNPGKEHAWQGLGAMGAIAWPRDQFKALAAEARDGFGEARRNALAELARLSVDAAQKTLASQDGRVAIELHTPTQLRHEGEPLLPLRRADSAALLAVWKQITLLRSLTTFSALTPADAERIAEAIHEVFRETHRRKAGEGGADPRDRPWAELGEADRVNYRRQARELAGALLNAGLGLRAVPAGAKLIMPDLPREALELLARSEHEHWVTERLRAGWRAGPKADAERRETPWLVKWEKLPPEVQAWDRQSVRMLQQAIAKAGFEVFVTESTKRIPEA